MTSIKLNDRAPLTGVHVHDDGYLEANVLTARTGVQQYLGDEMGRPDIPVVNVYRDQAEVFRLSSLETFSRLPMTLGHPPVMVDASNWKDYAVGSTGDDVLRDGEHLKIGIKITDSDAVAAVQAGKRELSVGYSAEIEWVDGVAPDGTKYQAIQKNIRANHVAIVDAGRAGKKARIGDAGKTWGATPRTMSEKGDIMSDALKTVVLGDTAVQVASDSVAGIEAFKAASVKALADASAEHDRAVAAKDADLAAKDAKIADLEAKVLSDADLDAKVEARAALVDQARKLSKDVKVAGLSDADIRKAALVARLGDAAVKDKSEAYIEAMFDIEATKAPSADPVIDTLSGTPVISNATQTRDDAYAARDKRLRESHLQKKEA